LRPYRRFPIRHLPDGRACLNLGSSARVAPNWNNVDSSWLFRLARHPIAARLSRRLGLISDYRWERLQKLDPSVVVWNLARGVPYPDRSFEVVYHSHVLEHIDREAAPAFLEECLRVLRPRGVIRVVVPDLETLARRYLAAVDRSADHGDPGAHSAAIDEIFDQMVRKVPPHRTDQSAFMRLLETMLIGDMARSGTRHRWMYDRFSLGRLLEETGFVEVRPFDAATSQIDEWNSFGLDREPDGTPYKPGSLYLEARRP
jgi:SAM-dependent methyltransferase